MNNQRMLQKMKKNEQRMGQKNEKSENVTN